MGKMLRNGWVDCDWLSAIECNYKDLERQLKKQFIHGLYDTDMFREMIWEVTKINENEKSQAKMCCLGQRESKCKEAIHHHEQPHRGKGIWQTKNNKNMHKDSPRKHTQTKMPAKQMCRHCGSSHPSKTMSGI